MQGASLVTWRMARVLDGAPQDVKWAPLVPWPRDNSLGVGLRDNGDWVVAMSTEGELVSPARKGYICLIAYTETPREQFALTLRGAVVAAGLPAELADTFPYEEVIQCGLEGSDYWGQLAMGWLESMSLHGLSERMKATLADAVESRRLSQRTRHRARRILKANSKNAP